MKKAQKQPPPIAPKATDTLRARVSTELKEQLQAALDGHRHYQGNVSEFMNDCARAYVLQTRRGRPPAFPIEFVEA